MKRGKKSPVRRKMLFKINYILHNNLARGPKGRIWMFGEGGRGRRWGTKEAGGIAADKPRRTRPKEGRGEGGRRQGGGSGGRGADKPKEEEGGE